MDDKEEDINIDFQPQAENNNEIEIIENEVSRQKSPEKPQKLEMINFEDGNNSESKSNIEDLNDSKDPQKDVFN